MDAITVSSGSVGTRRGPGGALARAGATVAPLAAVVLIVYVLLALAFEQGGYFPATFAPAATVALAGLGVLLVARAGHLRPAPRALVALALLGLLAIWTGLSGAWSPLAGVPRTDMQRDMLYVALFALGLVAANGRTQARVLVSSLLVVLFVVAGAGLLSRLAPALLSDHAYSPPFFKERLSYPLGYWNGFGALAAIGAVLALGLAADVRSRASMRAAAAGASVPMLVALYLSLSRGAWIALLAGLLALVALAPRRGALLTALGLAGGGVAIAVVRLQAHPLLLDGSRDAGGQGQAFAIELGAIVLAVVAAQAVLALAATPERLRALGRGILVSAAVVVIAVPLAGLLVRGASGTTRTGAAADAARGWIASQYHDFMEPEVPLQARGQARLLSARGSRSDAYRVALEGLRAHPLRGDGAGAFELRWLASRRSAENLRDAHSLELGTATELGLVGLALLAGFVWAVGSAAVRSRRGRGALRRAHASAVIAAVLVWLVHASIDWDWEMPALTGIVLVLAATLFETAGGRRPRAA